MPSSVLNENIEILAIPSFYSSYYLQALDASFSIAYTPESRFQKYNTRGFLIFRVQGRIGVIDNHDPVGVNQELYDVADVYFATNKLKNNKSYQQAKVKPLFPHYPVNTLTTYIKLFGVSLVTKLKPRDLAREIYVLNSRPKYANQINNYNYGNYVFFSGSTWKKEPWANQIRAEFIKVCKQHPKIEFEGGFIPRADGNNFGYDAEVNQVKYAPKKFSELSAKSVISLNNPAVLGAVSWRLAEYWNYSSFVLSFPFAIDLPVSPVHGENIHFINESEDYRDVLDLILENPEYHKKISLGGKLFFEKYCTPEAQAKYILDQLLGKSIGT